MPELTTYYGVQDANNSNHWVTGISFESNEVVITLSESPTNAIVSTNKSFSHQLAITICLLKNSKDYIGGRPNDR